MGWVEHSRGAQTVARTGPFTIDTRQVLCLQTLVRWPAVRMMKSDGLEDESYPWPQSINPRRNSSGQGIAMFAWVWMGSDKGATSIHHRKGEVSTLETQVTTFIL